ARGGPVSLSALARARLHMRREESRHILLQVRVQPELPSGNEHSHREAAVCSEPSSAFPAPVEGDCAIHVKVYSCDLLGCGDGKCTPGSPSLLRPFRDVLFFRRCNYWRPLNNAHFDRLAAK